MPHRVSGTVVYLVVLLFIGSILCSLQAEGAWLQVAIDPAGVEVEQGADGQAVFRCQGAQWLSQAGEPSIPWQVVTVLLPPQAVVETVSVNLQGARYEPVAGRWSVAPTRPPAYWDGEREVVVWPADRPIVAGRDISVYETDAFWPAEEMRLLSAGQLRKWRLVDVALPLIRTNPQTGSVLRLVGGTLRVSYETRGAGNVRARGARELADRRGESAVRRMAVNFHQQRAAYEAAAASAEAELEAAADGGGAAVGEGNVRPVSNDDGTPVPSASGSGYVIITTAAIESASTKLDDFVAHKELFGHTVQVITESDFGGGTGDTAAENIRAWLQAHYVSDDIEYVLLVGDPRPTTGDVPMKMLWPRHNEPDDLDAPSDYYYADLTGNWDKDGDGYYGEWGDDFGTGGVDRHYEVLVGRIPYYGSISDLDGILQKIMDYAIEHGAAAEWRHDVLLPMKPSDEDTPGYHLGEAIKNSFAVPQGWSYHRVYDENYGLVPPPETTPCTVTNVTNVWKNGTFGLIVWWTHGSATSAAGVMDVTHVPQLNDDYPGLTFQASCTNSRPETTNNLTYSLLKNGGIATIGATRVSWYVSGETNFNNSTTNAGMAYEYSERIMTQDMSSGEALHDLKQDMSPGGSAFWMNYCDFNIYGDAETFIDPRLVFIYVNGATGNDDWDGLAEEWDGVHGPKATIQAGVDVATGQATVVVADGTYSGPDNRGIDFDGKQMTVRSKNGPSSTIIDCGGVARGFTFNSGETDSSVVEGFTIQNGFSTSGGAILCSATSPRIVDCVITSCSATNGGAVLCNSAASPTIENCILDGNSASGVGAAIYCNASSPTLMNVTIVDNTASGSTGGVHCGNSSPTLTNCILWGNQPQQVYVSGVSSPALYNCDIAGGWTGAGSGNFDLDPRLASDQHILGDSPCRDAGTSSGAPDEDIDGESRPAGSGIDVGADELVDSDNDDLGDWSETHTYGTDPDDPDTDDDGMIDGYEVGYGYNPLDGLDGVQNDDSDALLNYEESFLRSDPHDGGSPAVLYVDDDNTGGPWDGTPAHPYETIQAAVDAATPPMLVKVLPGTYHESVLMADHVAVVGSGADLTMIDTENAAEAVLCNGGTSCVLAAVTIHAGADYNALKSTSSMLAVRECIATGSKSGYGAATSGLLHVFNCVSEGNAVNGLWDTGASVVIDNCTFADNGTYGVGHWSMITLTIRNTILWNNGDEIAGYTAWYSVAHCDIEDGDFAGTNGNISADPLFVTGPLHDYYLSQLAAGQGADSPCVDAGSDLATTLGLGCMTTRTDAVPDTGVVDMGYHVSSQVTVTSISRVGTDVTIEWDAAPGASYVVEWSANRLDWTPVSVGETGSWTDVGGGANPQRFYRVRPE